MDPQLEELCGVVEDVTYRREDTGFTVMDIFADDEYVTVVGVLPELSEGESVRLRGTWGYHATFGKQFKAQLCERSMPSSSADLLRYLSSGAVRGIGPATAKKIIERFGENSFDVLENQPERLADIKGISLKKAKDISKIFNEQFAVRQIMISLERFGMTTHECLEAYKLYGANAVDMIKANPYALCSDIVGMGFERADAIASALPEPPDRAYRVSAGIVHVVKYNLNNGHTCVPRKKLIAPSSGLLEADEDTIEAAIDALVESGRLISQMMNGKEFLFLPQIYSAEKLAAQRILVMTKFPPAGRVTVEEDIEKIEKEENIHYESKQREAILTAANKGILILTGGPGTGKTTALNGILKLFELDGIDVALTAPTGRAAKRMSEITGKEAKTIHRLLEVEWDKHDRPYFSRNARNPISAGAVIVDELSMVDISLFASLLDALPLGCRLIMVGDSDQLPAVGAGSVLHDLILSGVLPVVELKEVFRQAMQSRIVTNAHKIVSGQMPELHDKNNDFFFMKRNSAYDTAATVAELCTVRLPKAYSYSPINDIQVLCPSRKGETGTVSLNKRLQAVINPPSPEKKELQSGSRIFREGDKVMQIKNNYNIIWTKDSEEGTGVFNGDIGTVKKIDKANGCLAVWFDDKEAVYSTDNLQELEHAYAITVHKSQGNEFNAVVIPVMGVVPQLCYRNLLYTAVTRAKKLMVMVGSEKQIRDMVENNTRSKRYSALKFFLTEDEENDA
ncbi:MAG: ATP-dependent RecD-like DNA helicase [Oscillospiraceae bacterium]|mgnify:FL=1|nr:ATP-dependent RecD-like DNA helicase [Ruminococcus sp.]MDY6062088.1 ATP-dependent RecD-like DNA helicase [Oscillospiraceae bacterium]